MTKRESATERRRAQLLARSARLREDIARTSAGVTGRLGGAERSIKVARAITSTPVLLAAGAALLAYAGPAKAISLVGRGLVYQALDVGKGCFEVAISFEDFGFHGETWV